MTVALSEFHHVNKPMIHAKSVCRKLSTGCPLLDAALGGGIPTCGITEISGEAGSGAPQLNVNCAFDFVLEERQNSIMSCVGPAMLKVNQTKRTQRLNCLP